MQLWSSRVEIVAIGGIDHVDDDVNTAAVTLPHAAEAWLSANIPDFDADIALLDYLKNV